MILLRSHHAQPHRNNMNNPEGRKEARWATQDPEPDNPHPSPLLSEPPVANNHYGYSLTTSEARPKREAELTPPTRIRFLHSFPPR